MITSSNNYYFFVGGVLGHVRVQGQDDVDFSVVLSSNTTF